MIHVVQSQEVGGGDATTKVSSDIQRHSSSKVDTMADLDQLKDWSL